MDFGGNGSAGDFRKIKKFFVKGSGVEVVLHVNNECSPLINFN